MVISSRRYEEAVLFSKPGAPALLRVDIMEMI